MSNRKKMSRKPLAASSIAKITVIQVMPQTFNPTTRTSLFQLESFSKSLHMLPATPEFEKTDSHTWYSGVPIALQACITNTRFQAISNISLDIQGKISGNFPSRVLLKESYSHEKSLDPQKWILHPFQLTCPVEGTLEIAVTASFRFENTPYQITTTESYRIQPSLQIKYSQRSKPTAVIQFSITNKTPFRMMSVRSRTPNGDNILVAESMEEGDSASAFFRPSVPTVNLEISWSLPHVLRCSQTIRLKEIPEEKQLPFSLELSGVPETQPALKPFKITATLRNLTDKPLSGEIVINRSEQMLLTVGENDLTFSNVETEKTMEITLICMWQGSYQLPVFLVNLSDGKSYPVERNEGILVIGHADA